MAAAVELLEHPNPNCREFLTKIRALNTKSSSKIRELTELAIRYQNEALDISVVWESELRDAKTIRYQPLFSLVDSILKKASAAYKNPLGQILQERYLKCLQNKTRLARYCRRGSESVTMDIIGY